MTTFYTILSNPDLASELCAWLHVVEQFAVSLTCRGAPKPARGMVFRLRLYARPKISLRHALIKGYDIGLENPQAYTAWLNAFPAVSPNLAKYTDTFYAKKSLSHDTCIIDIGILCERDPSILDDDDSQASLSSFIWKYQLVVRTPPIARAPNCIARSQEYFNYVVGHPNGWRIHTSFLIRHAQWLGGLDTISKIQHNYIIAMTALGRLTREYIAGNPAQNYADIFEDAILVVLRSKGEFDLTGVICSLREYNADGRARLQLCLNSIIRYTLRLHGRDTLSLKQMCDMVDWDSRGLERVTMAHMRADMVRNVGALLCIISEELLREIAARDGAHPYWTDSVKYLDGVAEFRKTELVNLVKLDDVEKLAAALETYPKPISAAMFVSAFTAHARDCINLLSTRYTGKLPKALIRRYAAGQLHVYEIKLIREMFPGAI